MKAILAAIALAALAFIAQPSEAQATQCTSTHGSGLLLQVDPCGDEVTPGVRGTDIVRMGAWTDGSAMITSFQANVSFNAKSPPTDVKLNTQWFVPIGRDVATTNQACYFNGDTDAAEGWKASMGDSVAYPWLIQDDGCQAFGFMTSNFSYNWASYEGYYCNEIDVTMPYGDIGAVPGSVFEWGHSTTVGPLTGYYAPGTWDLDSGTEIDDVNPIAATFTLGNTSFQLTRTAPIVTFQTYDQQVKLHITQGPDNGVSPGFGFIIYQDGVRLNSYTPTFPAKAKPGAATFFPSGPGPYTYTIEDVPFGLHNYTVVEANCRGEGAPAEVPVNVVPVPPACWTTTAETTYPGQTANFAANGSKPRTWTSSGSKPGPVTSLKFDTSWPNPGNYFVKVENIAGNATCKFTVEPWPAPKCSQTKSPTILGNPTTMVATLGDGAYKWKVPEGKPDFGPGTKFVTTFDSTGFHDVFVTSYGKTGKCQALVVYPACRGAEADFEASTHQTEPGHPVTFTDKSKGTLAAHHWSFGDGTTSTKPSPVHTFTTAGTYHVRLMIYEAETYCDSAKTLDIQVGTAGQTSTATLQPVATSKDKTVNEGEPIHLDATVFPEDPTTRYHWRLGAKTWDTARIEHPAPMLQGEPVTLTFTLQVIQGNQLSPLSFVNVTVLPTNQKPTADAGTPIIAVDAKLVTLQSNSTDPDGDTLTYQWVQTYGVPVQLQGNDTANPSFQVPEQPGGYADFELIVTDGRFTARDTVRVVYEITPVKETSRTQVEAPTTQISSESRLSPWAFLAILPTVAAATTAALLYKLRPRKA